MTTEQPPVNRIDAVRDALNDIADGLLGRTTLSVDAWDAAVTTLATSHSHLGGHTRTLLYQFFQASDPGTDPRALHDALFALRAALSPPPQPRHVTGLAPRRRSTRQRRTRGQLAFF